MFETLAQVAVFATIVGVFIAIGAWVNGRRTTKEIKKIIDGLSEKMDEGFRTLGEKIDEGFRLIALLILAETPEEKKQIAKKILGEK